MNTTPNPRATKNNSGELPAAGDILVPLPGVGVGVSVDDEEVIETADVILDERVDERAVAADDIAAAVCDNGAADIVRGDNEAMILSNVLYCTPVVFSL